MRIFVSSVIIFALVLCGAHADDLFPNQGFRFNNRTVEFGFNAGGGFSNNLLTVADIFVEKIYLDLDSLNGGLKINAGINVTPFYFSINRNRWGVNFSVNMEAVGNIGLSNSLITFSEAVNEKSDAGLAVFSDASLDIFFHVKNFKFRIRPSVFYTAVYSKPDITYTFTTAGTTEVSIGYDARVYTAVKIDDLNNIQPNINSLSATPGVDIGFGIEYPVSRAAGLYKRIALFDFDVGVNVSNIPILASTMRHYMQMTGSAEMNGDTIEEFYNSLDTENFFSEPSYGEEKIVVERPFRTNLYINWRPLGNSVLTIIPNIGFSLNPMYLTPFSLEYGFKVRMDLANIFILSLGANYEDRVWKNRADVALNFRVLELNIGAELRTNDFFKVTNTSGLGIYAGLKIGF